MVFPSEYCYPCGGPPRPTMTAEQSRNLFQPSPSVPLYLSSSSLCSDFPRYGKFVKGGGGGAKRKGAEIVSLPLRFPLS